MRRKHQRRNLTKRWGVKAWLPPAKMVEIADERTEGMLAAFVTDGARADQLATLVRSAYMQGVNDAAYSLAVTQGKDGENGNDETKTSGNQY